MTANKYKKIFIYLFILITLISATLTFTIELIIKSMVTYVRVTGWMAEHQILIIIMVLAICLFFSMLFAKWLSIWMYNTRSLSSKYFLFITLSSTFVILLIYWSTARSPFPNILITSKNGRFVAGPYPDNKMLEELKHQGYSSVISLMDPLMLPDEPILISREKKAAAAAGITLIQIPMLPGTMLGLKAQSKIIDMARQPGNYKYYVHDYYGRTRIDLFMDLVNQTPIEKPKLNRLVLPDKYHTLVLERGNAIQIDDHVIVSPKPTTAEIEKYILTSPNDAVMIPIRSVVSLNADEQIQKPENLIQVLNSKNIAFLTMPVALYPYDADKILAVAAKVKSLSGGTLVYSYFMPPESIIMSGFIISYFTSLPAIPKQLFANQPMENGKVEVIGPNTAIGPKPAVSEFTGYLIPRGIRFIGYIGACSGAEYHKDQQAAEAAGLKWVCLQANNAMLDQVVEKNGPWFIYGSDLPLFEDMLKAQLSKLMPDSDLLGG